MAPSGSAGLGLLSVISPTPEQTLFLKAALLSGDECRAAWRQWIAAGGDEAGRLSSDRSGTRRLIPVLHENLSLNRVEVEPSLLTVMRSGSLREDRRMEAYVAILRLVLDALAAADLPVLVLKGGALAGTVYARWGLRHCHDIDLLVADADIPRAHSALVAKGYMADGPLTGRVSGDTVLRHESGMPIILHRRLFLVPYYRPPLDIVWQASTSADSDLPMRVMDPARSLVHVLGHAATSSSRDTLQWACDAMLLLRSMPEMDWAAVESFIEECRLALPLAVLLGYLSRELHAPVPAGVISRLESKARSAGQAELDAAFAGAFATSRKSLISMLRDADSRATRKLLLRWMVAPSPDYMRWSRHVRHEWLLPLYYLERPFQYLRGYARARLRKPASH